jgi:hypothetical protein
MEKGRLRTFVGDSGANQSIFGDFNGILNLSIILL